MKFTTYCWIVTVAMLIAPAVLAIHEEDKGPEKFGRYEFKEQDIKEATDACDAGGKPGPEFVPTVRDKEPNLALLKEAEATASSQLEGWCPRRHCIEYLNDGFYNNCRSWIIGAIPGWAQIDMGAVANVNRIFFASDHSQGFLDRTTADFDILVATKKADADSDANTWTKVYEHKGEPVSKTTEFTFKDVEARWVRLHIRANGGARVDEIEIYGGRDPMAVEPTGKLTTVWGQVKSDKF
ncbi:hypothetical protein C6495_01535 [Candidatus Poribacteria bacterium]|nr:MAG: hypothetical protein C6495_01535 [Candidatus Poribacteria bacterium]